MTAAGMDAMPLAALDAVVLDTETTGLDVRAARIVQLGAVRLRQGLVAAEELDRLVHPGEPVPPKSTEIHGLTDADVAGAPAFAAVAPELERFVAGHVVIGHNVGFDLAMLAAEYRRAALPWKPPRSLDVRLLAQVAAPARPDFSVDALADWLGIAVAGRHTAIGDARATAATFVALVPYLRRRNIRTLAEAEAACAELAHLLEEQHKAGWGVPARREAAELSERALARIDAYPYRHRIGEAMKAPPLFVAPDLALREALRLLIERKVSSLFVAAREPAAAADTGILTERDVMRALAGEGEAVLDVPVGRYMSTPLECVPQDEFLYLAIARMARLRVRHLGVVDEDGRVVGALSQRDLLRLRAGDAVTLGDEIAHADSTRALAAAWARRAAVARGLKAEGVPGRDIAAVISQSICAISRRAAELAEAGMAADGKGPPPASYVFAVLGSAGRGESMLAADQDNALIHADLPEAEAEAADAWFAEFGRRVSETLDGAGIPLCKGGIMAVNPGWRGNVSQWKERIAGWMRKQEGREIHYVDLFFDLLAVHGDAALARELWHHGYERAGASPYFIQLLAEMSENIAPPLTFFGGLRTSEGRVDLKSGGLYPLVAAARVLSIRYRVLERATPARFAGAGAAVSDSAAEIERLSAIHALLMDLVLDQQIADIERGVVPSNRVETARLGRERTRELKRALHDLKHRDEMVRNLLFPA